MRNKTTYEMEDVMNLIAKDLADKGLAPDPASMEVWACIDGARVSTKEIEVEVNVSWVGIPTRADDGPPRARARREPAATDANTGTPPADLLDEAPPLSGRPHVTFGSIADSPGPGEVGINDVTAASREVLQAGGEGPFSKARVARRLSDDESFEWPGNSPDRRR